LEDFLFCREAYIISATFLAALFCLASLLFVFILIRVETAII